MSDANWLENLKVGDKVLKSGGGFRLSYSVLTVEKIGKVHITAGGRKFRKANGRMAGESNYRFERIIPYDAKLIADQEAESERLKLAYSVSETRWRDLPLKTLKAIAALLPERPEAKEDSNE